MNLSRSDLLGALDAVKGAIAEKSFVPILTHVLISESSVLGYDSEIGVRVKLATPVGGTFNVRFDPFFNLLKNLEEEELNITIESSKKIRIQCGSHRSMLTQIDEPFPKPEVKIGKGDWVDVPAGFKEALERALMATSEDEQNKALSSVFVTGDRVYGADGKRVVRCTVDGLKARPLLLSRKAVTELIKLGNPKRVAISNSTAVFDFLNLAFLARLRDGTEYPAKGFDGLFTGRAVSQPIPDGLSSALTRLQIFAGGEAPCIKVSPLPLGLEFSCQSELSSAVEMLAPSPVPLAVKALGPAFLQAALPFADGLDWGKPFDPVYLSGEVAKFECLVAPMRVGE